MGRYVLCHTLLGWDHWCIPLAMPPRTTLQLVQNWSKLLTNAVHNILLREVSKALSIVPEDAKKKTPQRRIPCQVSS